MTTPRYRELDDAKIGQTLERLRRRIGERFPESGLSRVCEELIVVSRETKECVAYLRSPIWPVRIGVAVAIAGMLVVLVMAARAQGLPGGWSELDSAKNSVVFLGVAAFFLTSIEPRLKRRRALKVVHQIRSLAHVIDMHQLTKDPERLLSPEPDTSSSPARTMTPLELGRYLDYCSELLSVSSKLAALLVQYFDDPVLLGAVDGIETLATGLQGKIWQKIQLLDSGRITHKA
jgi:hypothetical protein